MNTNRRLVFIRHKFVFICLLLLSHILAAQKMQMQMRNYLAAVPANVKNQLVAGFANAIFNPHISGNQHHFPHDRFVLDFNMGNA